MAKILNLNGFIVTLKEGRELTEDERQELTEYLEWCRDQTATKKLKVENIKKIMKG